MPRNERAALSSRLRAALNEWGWEVQELADASGVHRNTVGRHLDPKGPAPREKQLEAYEAALRLPRHALTTKSETEIRRHIGAVRTEGAGGSAWTIREPSRRYREGFWDADDGGESAVRELLRNPTRMGVDLIGNPDLFTASERESIQLWTLNAIKRQLTLANKPVPRYLGQLEREVKDGRFQ